MRIASKSLISITCVSRLLSLVVAGSVFEVDRLGVVERADRRVLVLRRGGVDLEGVEVLERLVRGERELAVGVDAVLALLELLPGGLARRRAERAGREVDPELLRGAEQLVV